GLSSPAASFSPRRQDAELHQLLSLRPVAIEHGFSPASALPRDRPDAMATRPIPTSPCAIPPRLGNGPSNHLLADPRSNCDPGGTSGTTTFGPIGCHILLAGI